LKKIVHFCRVTGRIHVKTGAQPYENGDVPEPPSKTPLHTPFMTLSNPLNLNRATIKVLGV